MSLKISLSTATSVTPPSRRRWPCDQPPPDLGTGRAHADVGHQLADDEIQLARAFAAVLSRPHHELWCAVAVWLLPLERRAHVAASCRVAQCDGPGAAQYAGLAHAVHPGCQGACQRTRCY